MTILDALIQNAGPHFQRSFADEPLLERLRIAATDSLSDEEVKKKCTVLFRQWAASYKNAPGMARVVNLHKQVPQRKKPVVPANSKVLRETEVPDVESGTFSHGVSVSSGGAPVKNLRSPLSSPTSPSFSSDVSGSAKGKADKKLEKSKKVRTKPFNIEAEKPAILQSIAGASLASTNLLNALKLINRERQRVSENKEAVKCFETCKVFRRQILGYLQRIESGDLLGALIQANDALVEALIEYEKRDKDLDDDSDSDEEWDADKSTARARSASSTSIGKMTAGLSLHGAAKSPPPRPPKPNFALKKPPVNDKGKAKEIVKESEGEENEDEEEEDENDPFADRNALDTPSVEKSGMTW